ncbi:MAG: M42 family metallopeptidase [Symbiobacteriaceae bacterium]|nr:M42 family metallopeptidase [Symbiobacteriaceae bacterium]
MLLKKLCEASGVSGNEQEVRDVLTEALKDYIDDWQRDKIGNLVAVVNRNAPGPRVMIAAHMDEVGLMIYGFEKNGLLRFRPVGGVDLRVLVSKPVLVGKNRVPGVIGAKAIHLQRPEERQNPIPVDQLTIDIGCSSKEEAEEHVKLGDYVVFDTLFEEQCEGTLKAKALDDRVGCAVLAEVMQGKYSIPVYGAFTVQEEIGTRGARVAAFQIMPDVAIAIEGTVCNDIADNPEAEYTTEQGKGVVINFMDGGLVAHRKLFSLAVATAEKHGIPYQFRRSTSGGNDAGAMSLTGAGCPALAVAVPTRYIHSPVSTVKKSDMDCAVRFVTALVHAIEDGGLNQ